MVRKFVRRVIRIAFLAGGGVSCSQRVFGGGLWITARVFFQVLAVFNLIHKAAGLFAALVIQVRSISAADYARRFIVHRDCLSFVIKID